MPDTILISKLHSLKSEMSIESQNSFRRLIESYVLSKTHNDTTGKEIIEIITTIRSSKHTESELDMDLLDLQISVARTLNEANEVLRNLLKDALYYSHYLPSRYNKTSLETELNSLTLWI